MNAIMTVLPPSVSDIAGFQSWVAEGKRLLADREKASWLLADWLNVGLERFVDQAGFDFLADELGIAPKALKSAAKVAAAFPPHMRDTALTFQHHEAVATLPADEALRVLKDAKAGHLDPRETRIAAIEHKAAIEQRLPMEDDDPAHRQLTTIQHAWNRATKSVRLEFLELATEANGGLIDA